jgi:hypothetical protein
LHGTSARQYYASSTGQPIPNFKAAQRESLIIEGISMAHKKDLQKSQNIIAPRERFELSRCKAPVAFKATAFPD